MVKRSCSVAGIFLVAVLFSSHALGSEGLMKDFVLLDKAFIPPLLLTNREKADPSKKAMEVLKAQWAEFKRNHYKARPKDPGWKQDLDRVEAKIMEADQIVLSEENLMAAHEILETIRYALKAARSRNGIDYYIDYLSEFHEHMEAILHTANERDESSFSEKDLQFVTGECAEATRIWTQVQSVPFDRELFGFSDAQEARRKELLEKEAQALQRLQLALEGNDKMLIITSAKEIRPPYAQLYLLFGDFTPFRDSR